MALANPAHILDALVHAKGEDGILMNILERLFKLDGMYNPNIGYELDHFVSSQDRRNAAAATIDPALPPAPAPIVNPSPVTVPAWANNPAMKKLLDDAYAAGLAGRAKQ